MEEQERCTPPICPNCGQDLFAYYCADQIIRYRCLCSPARYSEAEYIIKSGEMPVRKRICVKECDLGDGEIARIGICGRKGAGT